MERNICLLISLIILLQKVAAQDTEVISLRFIDSKTQHPIAEVFVAQDKSIYISNKEGEVLIPFTQNRKEINISHLHYRPIRFSIKNDTLIHLESKNTFLDEVEVRGFEQRKPIMEQPAPISYIESKDLTRFNETNFVHAVNTMPGIQMEERAPLSYRVSVRGSSLRSPFGVRNVKIYWNDLPLTEPNGVTPLNLIDLSNVDDIEVIKGPAGSLFGAGTGGVIQLSSASLAALEEGYGLGIMVGSFGMLRVTAQATNTYEQGATEMRFSTQQANGYREHSGSDRKTAQITQHLSLSDNHQIRLNTLLSSVDYQIPGGLTEEEFLENPRAARPMSATQNAGVQQRSVYLGVVSDYTFTKWHNKSVIFNNISRFDNPFITDYKTEKSISWGIRSLFDRDYQIGQTLLKLTVGGEYSHNLTNASNFGNRAGQTDTIRFRDFLNVSQAFAFLQTDWQLPRNWTLTGALSYNYMRYSIDRKQDMLLDTAYLFIRNFEPQLIPRIAILKGISKQWAIHASLSSGFSPPTISEVRTNEGTINSALDAERGLNYEAGFRWMSKNKRWLSDATFFYLQLKETITTETSEEGVVLFRNAGATNQPGIEYSLRGSLLRHIGIWQEITTHLAYTGHFFRFQEYSMRGEDFSGNALTGVSPHFTSVAFDFFMKKGFYYNITHQFSDAIPLNDANTIYASSYHLLNLRAGYQKLIKAKWQFEIFAGIDNILNQTYSLGNDLNAFGGRYFQAAPLRNYYGGLKIKYLK